MARVLGLAVSGTCAVFSAMRWWKKYASVLIPALRLQPEPEPAEVPALQLQPEPDPAKVLADMRAHQAAFGRKSASRIIAVVLISFCAIEIAGNFKEFSRDYVAIVTGTFGSDTFSGWELTAHLSSPDVTVLVTALMVFNATFAVAFIATFLIPVKSKEFEYFRIDWAHTVQILAVNSGSLAVTLTITRFIDAPALFATLFFITISIILASQLVNSSFLAQRTASMAIFEWRRKQDEADNARKNFLSTLNETTCKRLRRKIPSAVTQVKKQCYRYHAAIVASCGLLLLAEAVIIVAAISIFELHTLSSFRDWLLSILYIFILSFAVLALPLALLTYGQSKLWVGYARKQAFASLMRVPGIIAVFALTLLFFLPYVGTPEWLIGGFLACCNALVVGIAAAAVHWGKQTGRGPGKYVLLYTLAILDEAFLYAEKEYAQSEIKLSRH